MAEVNLTIDGRSYPIACDDGQEGRLVQLGSYVDHRMKEVAIAGANNKTQALVLASLVLADEVFDLNDKLADLSQDSSSIAQVHQEKTIEFQGLSPNDEQSIVTAIGHMASKVEKLTARIQRKSVDKLSA